MRLTNAKTSSFPRTVDHVSLYAKILKQVEYESARRKRHINEKQG